MPTFSQTDVERSTDPAEDLAKPCTSTFRVAGRLEPCPRPATFEVITGCPCSHVVAALWCDYCYGYGIAGQVICTSCEIAAHLHRRFVAASSPLRSGSVH